MHIRTF